MNTELMEALDTLEKEKNISKETLLEAIEQSLIQACKNHFGKADNVNVNINPETCDFDVYADQTVVETVTIRYWKYPWRMHERSCKCRDRRYGPGSDTSREVWKNRHTECQECDPSEDP